MIVVNIRDEHDVYGGRPRRGKAPEEIKPGEHGWLGNPFSKGTREQNIQNFRSYFWERINTDARFREEVVGLMNKRVACFCHPNACHLDQVKAWLDAGQPLE